MTFFSVLFALVIEQFHALGSRNPVHQLVRSMTARIEHWLDAGQYKHGIYAWCVVVVPLVIVVATIHYLLLLTEPWLAFVWNVTVVYLTLGFRQFSHHFTAINDALNADDIGTARAELRIWTGMEPGDMAISDIVRYTLEHAIIGAHRHVFGVFFWFLIPFGPAGCVLYRMAEYLARIWSQPAAERSPTLHLFACRMFAWIDWLPSRLTALGFSIVGNFEDAMYAWRNEAGRWPNRNEGILLAVGGGALGVQLGGPLSEPASENLLTNESPLLKIGEETSVRALQSAIGLVWRAVVLWMLLLAMLSIAVWLS